jgi:hypothetical protein
MRDKRRILIMAFGIISVAAITYILKESLLKFSNIDLKSSAGITLEIIPVILTILGTGFVLFNYLEGGLSFSRKDLKKSVEIENDLDEIKKELEKAYSKVVGKGLSKDEIKSFISDQIANQNQETIITKVEEKFGAEIIKNLKFEQINSELLNLEKNISIYVQKLSRGSSINLVIGAFTTIAAVMILGIFIFEKQIDFSDTTEVLAHYIPRISIAIFIEIFSFFFLKLYKSNLNDIKYFENERTNINSKRLALKFAYLTDNKDSINIILNELAKTERNFILKKDESTVNIEKLKIEKDNESNTVSTLLNLIKLKDK